MYQTHAKNDQTLPDQLSLILAERISGQLARHGWTMRTLSERSGVPYETLKKIMNAKVHSPSFKNVYLIASALDCSIDELAGRSPDGWGAKSAAI